jgi:alkyl hydroperoxide reductase subunit AhpF
MHYSNMMTTMPTSFTDAVNDMKSQAVSQAVTVLAEKYGFSLEDALREVKVSKVEAKAEKAVKGAKKKAEKAEKGEKGEKTKRALSGYQVYMKHMRSEVSKEMEANLEEGEKLKPKDVMTELGARWKALSDSEKDEWKTKATELKGSSGSDSD